MLSIYFHHNFEGIVIIVYNKMIYPLIGMKYEHLLSDPIFKFPSMNLDSKQILLSSSHGKWVPLYSNLGQDHWQDSTSCGVSHFINHRMLRVHGKHT